MNTWRSTIVSLSLVTLISVSCTPASQGESAAPGVTKPAASERPDPSSSKWDELVAAAKKEGTLTYYISANPENRTAISQAFQKRFGINVEVVAGTGGELYSKLQTERQAGIFVADVVGVGENFSTSLRKAGALEPLDPYLVLPETIDPKAWPDGSPHFFDKQHTSAVLTYYYQPFILINTDMVKKDDLSAYSDLLEAKWKGKITLLDPSTFGAGLYWVVFLQRAMGEEGALRFARELAKQDLGIIRDSRLHAEWVARGKYPVGIAWSMVAVTDLFKMGAPISPHTLKEGGLVATGTGNVSVLNKAPHPNAARVMVNWLLSQEGSKVNSESSSLIPMRADISPTWVPPSLVPPKGAKVFWADEEFVSLVNEKGRDVAKLFFGELVR